MRIELARLTAVGGVSAVFQRAQVVLSDRRGDIQVAADGATPTWADDQCAVWRNRQVNRQGSTQIREQRPSGGGLLQRKCDCGNHTIAGDECEECKAKKKSGLQTKLQITPQATPSNKRPTASRTRSSRWRPCPRSGTCRYTLSG